ncbi:hypothetical protein ACVXHA_09445 [Escherichia coli]
MDCALAAMGPAFQQVYSLLPTLLHYHHPLMPGYLDGKCPKGICLYTPDETQRHYLNELELSVECQYRTHRKVSFQLLVYTPWAAPRP